MWLAEVLMKRYLEQAYDRMVLWRTNKIGGRSDVASCHSYTRIQLGADNQKVCLLRYFKPRFRRAGDTTEATAHSPC